MAPAPSPTIPARPDLALEAENIAIYPKPYLVAGDLATFQVQVDVPPEIAPRDVDVHIYVDDVLLIDGVLGRRSLGGNAMGLYEWVWDTSNTTGSHTIRVELDPADTLTVGDENPDNNAVTLTTTISEPDDQAAGWVTQRTAHATLHVVAGSAAERDLNQLALEVDAAIREAADQLNMFPPVNINIYFADRVIGNGGYANTGMVISYPERNYAGGDLRRLLVHETVHVLDNEFEPGSGFRFFVEGLAMWATGGHYKAEDLHQRMAALYFETDRYLPLGELMDDFYPSQHEIAYLQAGSFFRYLVETYGWDRVRFFYSDLKAAEEGSAARAATTAMQAHFGKTLQQLEGDWLAFLRNQPRSEAAARDLALSIDYYETMRLYQQIYDPSAYFLTAWLPTPAVLVERQLTAELDRQPSEELNVWLETMLVSADNALLTGNYDDASALLNSVRRVLRFGDTTGDPLATTYLTLVRAVLARGLDVQSITIENETARIVAVDSATNIEQTLLLAHQGQEWVASD